MRSSTTTSDDQRTATIAIEFEAPEIQPKRDEVLTRLQREVRLPGFRRGKVPRQLLLKRIGEPQLVREAVEAILEERLGDVIAESGLDVIGTPVIEALEPRSDGGASVSLQVELRPSVQVSDWRGIVVEVPDPRVSDEEINAIVERLLEQRAEVRDVERPVALGDQITLNVWRVEADGTETLETPDLVVRLGRGQLPQDVEERLVGASVGDRIPRGEGARGDASASATQGADETSESDGAEEVSAASNDATEVYEVVAVREIVLPPITDELVEEVTGAASLEALRGQIAADLAVNRRRSAQEVFERELLRSLLERTEPKTVPAALVDPVYREEIRRFGSTLDASGISLRRYLDLTGLSRDEVAQGLSARSAEYVLTDLALRAIAREAGLEVDDDELARELDAAVASGRLRDRSDGERPAVRARLVADILTHKALALLQREARIVTPGGVELTLADLGLAEVVANDLGEPSEEQADAREEVESPEGGAPAAMASSAPVDDGGEVAPEPASDEAP